MDPDRLKLKEKVEAEVRKDMNKVVEDETDEAKQQEVQEQKEPVKKRLLPSFMIYFQIYDIVTKGPIVEFEDFSTSRVKSSLVKKEVNEIVLRIIANKQEKDITVQTPSGFENHVWMCTVNKKNWITLRKIKSVFS